MVRDMVKSSKTILRGTALNIAICRISCWIPNKINGDR